MLSWWLSSHQPRKLLLSDDVSTQNASSSWKDFWRCQNSESYLRSEVCRVKSKGDRTVPSTALCRQTYWEPTLNVLFTFSPSGVGQMVLNVLEKSKNLILPESPGLRHWDMVQGFSTPGLTPCGPAALKFSPPLICWDAPSVGGGRDVGSCNGAEVEVSRRPSLESITNSPGCGS